MVQIQNTLQAKRWRPKANGYLDKIFEKMESNSTNK